MKPTEQKLEPTEKIWNQLEKNWNQLKVVRPNIMVGRVWPNTFSITVGHGFYHVLAYQTINVMLQTKRHHISV